MTPLRLRLFGAFAAEFGSRRVTLPRKAQALMAYLALSPAERHTRTALATLCWGDSDDESARNSLRQVLFRTRRALGRAASVLIVDDEEVGLDRASVESDVATFRRLVVEDDETSLRSAVELYRGGLLEGLRISTAGFDEWVRDERERLHELAVGALRHLLDGVRRRGSEEDVIDCARQLLGLEPWHEEGHRALMRAYTSQGRRAAALHQYQVCVEILRREFQSEPERETRALYLELLRQPPSHDSASGPLEAPRRGVVRPLPSGPPVIGRIAEIGTLTRALEETLGGAARTVALVGDAGLGKTRLLQELVTAADARGFLVLQARAYETEQGLPFALWVNAVRSARLFEGAVNLDALDSEWHDALGPLFPELPGRRRRGAVESENAPRLFEALTQLLVVAANVRPVLVALEDLQYADATSVRLLSFVGRHVRAARVCLAVTARSEAAGEGSALAALLRELGGGAAHDDIVLAPLPRPDAIRLIRSLAPPARQRRTAPVVQRLWQLSEGNPLVIVETVRMLGERAWPRSGADVVLPDRVQQVIVDRIRRLGPAAQEVAGVAAIANGELEVPLLVRATAMPDHETTAGIDELVRRGVLRHVGEGRLSFTHERLREAVIASLADPRRGELHVAVALAIEATRARTLDDEQATLAEHYREAGRQLRAVDCLRRASTVAAARGAFREATDLLDFARGMLTALPREPAVLEREIDVRNELWDRVLVGANLERAREAATEALALARDLGDEERVGLAMANLAFCELQYRNLEPGRRLAEEAFRIGEQRGDTNICARAANSLGLILYASGRIQDAVAVFALGIKAAGEDPLMTFSVGMGLCHVHLRGWQAQLLAELGRFDEGLALGREALARAESVRNIYSTAFARLSLGRLLLLRGDVAAALAQLESGHELSKRYEVELVRRVFMPILAQACALAGRGEDALRWAAQGLPRMPRTALARAYALSAAGRPVEAARAAEECLEMAQKVREHTVETAALILLGELHHRSGALERARPAFERAREIAAGLGLRAFETHAQRGLGVLLADLGDHGPARHHLSAALGLYREMGMTAWIEETATALVRLPADTAWPRDP